MTIYQNLVQELHNAQENKDREKESKVLFKIAILYYERGDTDRSKAIFKELLRENKKLKEANYYLALISLNENKNDTARKYLEKELTVNPHSKATKQLKEKLEIHTNIPLVTLMLVLLNSLVFVFTFPTISYSQLLQFSLTSSTMSFFHMITSLFTHSTIYHFGINMVILVLFGLYLEKHIGSLNFLGIYLISGIAGNVIQAIANTDAFVLGASTAVFGILGAVVMREPLLDVRVLGFYKVPIIIVLGGYFVVENLFQFTLLGENILFGNVAHIMGFLFGVLLTGMLYQDTIEVFYNWLAIAFGFLIISYALVLVLETVITIQAFSLFILLLIIASIIIWYSYEKLKLMNIINEEHEFNN